MRCLFLITLWTRVVRIADCPAWDAALAAPFILMTCCNPLIWGVTLIFLVAAAVSIGGPGVIWVVVDVLGPRAARRPRSAPFQLLAFGMEGMRTITLGVLLLGVLNVGWELDTPWLWTAAIPWRVVFWIRVIDLVVTASELLVDSAFWAVRAWRSR